MRSKRPFLKHKFSLYFDENIPDRVVRYFRSGPSWWKKVKITSARELGLGGRSDSFHYDYCQRHKHTLVTRDLDFDNDKIFPFTFGRMPGIIMIKASSDDVARIIDILGRALTFVTWLPLPRAFLAETNLWPAVDGVTMRGPDSETHEIKSLHAIAGVTLTREIREFFSF
jgi:predicted nuclease of predicted toxin-antitoxin system